MSKLLWLFVLVFTSHAATLLRIACGGTGGVDSSLQSWAHDAYFNGGSTYTAGVLAGKVTPYDAMRSSSPVGAPFSYTLPVNPPTTGGQYIVTLKFTEPRVAQTIGQRIMSISVNGVVIKTGLDIFAAVGALKPLDLAFQTTAPAGVIQIDMSAQMGNAILSGIQVDSVDPPPVTIGSKPPCEVVLSGGGTIAPNVYGIWACENLGTTPTIVKRLTCRSDVDGQMLDLLAKDATGTFVSLLTTPMTCGPVRTDGILVSGASYLPGELLMFAFRVVFLVSYTSPLPNTVASQFVADVVLSQ